MRRHPVRLTIDAILARWRGGVLAKPLAQASDGRIDAALRRAGLARAVLFRPSGTLAAHRERMARMLARWGIAVPQAVSQHWPAVKTADERCSRCPDTERCQRWLDQGEGDGEPLSFCPNARLFLDIAGKQHPVRDD